MAPSASLVKQRRALAKLWLRWRFVLAAAVLLVVVIVGGGAAWRHVLAARAAQLQADTQAASEAIADALSATVQAEAQATAALLRSADLPALIAGGDAEAIAATETEMAARRPELLRARILPLGGYRTDYDTSPPFSFASIDLLRRSEAAGREISPEVHLFGEDDEHVALASRVENAEGELVGHVLFALDLDVLRDSLESIQVTRGYFELWQPVEKGPALAVVKRGDAASREGLPTLRIPVPTTSWRIAYWPDTPAVGGELPVPPWALAALALIVLGGGVVLARRRGAAQGPSDEARVAGVKERLEALRSGKPPPPPPEGEPAPIAEPAPEASDGLAGEGVIEVEEVDELPGEEALDATVFRAYDIRGVVGSGLSAGVVRRIGQAVGTEAGERGQQTLVVACDGRDSGPELLEALVEGLTSTGRDVVDVGRVPTPVLYYATHYLNTGSGVMVTGSHNPPEYNGLKIMLGGDTLFGDDIQALRGRIESGELATGAGKRQEMEIVDEYIRRVTEDVPVALGSAYKVVVDCGNAIAGTVAPKLIRALGHDVVELHCEVDGAFPNHHPDPSQPENLADLIAAVREHDADIGLAFDGDGDRLGVVDPDGNVIWPDRQLMLFAHDVLKHPEHQGAEIVFDVKCTSLLGKVIAKSGGKPVMCKTGHSFLKNELKQRGAPLAGELSGHIFFKDRWYGFDDALYAAARLLEILLATKRKPKDVFARLPSGVATHEMRVDLAEGEQMAFMERLLAEPRFDDGKVTTIDGLRVDYPHGWGLVRASNTTPSLVLRFEGKDAEGLAAVQERFREVLRSIDEAIELPF